MKKTSKELLDFFGLEVEDRVVIDGKHEYEVKYFECYVIKYRLVKVGIEYDRGEPLIMLMNCERGYEVIKSKKEYENSRFNNKTNY